MGGQAKRSPRQARGRRSATAPVLPSRPPRSLPRRTSAVHSSEPPRPPTQRPNISRLPSPAPRAGAAPGRCLPRWYSAAADRCSAPPAGAASCGNRARYHATASRAIARSAIGPSIRVAGGCGSFVDELEERAPHRPTRISDGVTGGRGDPRHVDGSGSEGWIARAHLETLAGKVSEASRSCDSGLIELPLGTVMMTSCVSWCCWSTSMWSGWQRVDIRRSHRL